MTRLAGNLLLGGVPVPGAIEFGDVITGLEVHGPPLAGDAPYLAPGFIDVHVHGGGGGDTMDGPEGVVALASYHLTRGTTTILPTTMTNPWENVVRALEGVAEVMEGAPAAGAQLPDIPGAHLEGPFISPHKLGAQPAFTQLPTAELVAEVLDLGVVSLVTMAPEIEHATEAARTFGAAGVRVSCGHTVATYDQASALLAATWERGSEGGFTHLYNAMSQLGSREPGVVGAALASGRAYAELILDLHHVHPASFRAAHAAKPDRLLLITDAIRATGLGDGESELGGLPVTVRGGAARLADGTLAGSVLTLDRAVRNAVEAGLELHQAVALVTATPAAYLGLSDRGVLEAGRRADIVVLDDDLEVIDVYVAGRRLT